MTQKLIDYHKNKMRLAEAEGRTEDYKFHKDAIEILSRPSLPSDLDEAAEEYGRKEYSHAIHFWDEGLSKNKPEVMKEDFVDSFKAGAEWMAGQGAFYNTKVGWIDGPTILDWPDDILDKFEMGDEVIVQIRKK